MYLNNRYHLLTGKKKTHWRPFEKNGLRNVILFGLTAFTIKAERQKDRQTETVNQRDKNRARRVERKAGYRKRET